MLCALAVSSITAQRSRFRSYDIHHNGALQLYRISVRLKCLIWSHNLCAVRLSETFLRHHLMQPTVILPGGSILTGRPIGIGGTCAGLCKVFGRGTEGCGRRIGMIDVWAMSYRSIPVECALMLRPNSSSQLSSLNW